MSKRIEVPADLEHLIEKRDEEKDRRTEARSAAARAKASGETAAKAERRSKATDEKRGAGSRVSPSVIRRARLSLSKPAKNLQGGAPTVGLLWPATEPTPTGRSSVPRSAIGKSAAPLTTPPHHNRPWKPA